MRHRLRWLLGWCEIDFFPPSSLWQEDEIKVLCNSFRQLFEAYNYDAAMPWDITLELEYDSWLTLLRQEAACMLTIFEGNSYEPLLLCKCLPSECPFADSCINNGEGSCSDHTQVEQWDRYFL